jgi:signal transduction histidine kinase
MGTGAAGDDSRTRRGLAVRAALVYLVAGAAWILLSDLALYGLIDDRATVARLETTKGWVFTAISALAVYLISARLIAVLQRTGATMSAVVESIADGVMLVGNDKNIVDANPAALHMLRIDKKSLVGMTPEGFSRRFHATFPDGRVVPPEDFASQRTLRGEHVPPYKLILHPRPSDELVITSTTAPVRSPSRDGVDLVVSVMRDETEHEHLDRLRDEFFTAAAHSLNTPLAVMKGHAQLLSARASEPVDRNAAAAIDRQCDRSARLVQNLLVASRLRSNTLKLDCYAFPLLPLLTDIAEQMRHAAKDRQLVPELDQTGATIFGDPERVAQAVRNLVDDALQASPPGTAVTLSLATAAGVARVGVRSESAPGREEPPRAWAPPPGRRPLSGLDVGRRVAEELVQIQGGRTHREVSAGVTTTWVEFPSRAPESP